MVLGFIGTCYAMTNEQKREVRVVLESRKPTAVHHGDCIGSAAQFHEMVLHKAIIHLHPSTSRRWRAFSKGADHEYLEKPAKARNRDIVDVGDELIVTPSKFQKEHQESRSGLWEAVGYCCKKYKVTVILWPYGRWEILW